VRIAYIIGTAIATIKVPCLSGHRLLLARETGLDGKPKGEPFVAVDTVDAGTGDLVIVTDGSSARYTDLTRDLPVDAVVVGVLDSLETGGTFTWTKG
jgi:microcompartment protein CcmK/EutM